MSSGSLVPPSSPLPKPPSKQTPSIPITNASELSAPSRPLPKPLTSSPSMSTLPPLPSVPSSSAFPPSPAPSLSSSYSSTSSLGALPPLPKRDAQVSEPPTPNRELRMTHDKVPLPKPPGSLSTAGVSPATDFLNPLPPLPQRPGRREEFQSRRRSRSMTSMLEAASSSSSSQDLFFPSTPKVLPFVPPTSGPALPARTHSPSQPPVVSPSGAPPSSTLSSSSSVSSSSMAQQPVKPSSNLSKLGSFLGSFRSNPKTTEPVTPSPLSSSPTSASILTDFPATPLSFSSPAASSSSSSLSDAEPSPTPIEELFPSVPADPAEPAERSADDDIREVTEDEANQSDEDEDEDEDEDTDSDSDMEPEPGFVYRKLPQKIDRELEAMAAKYGLRIIWDNDPGPEPTPTPTPTPTPAPAPSSKTSSSSSSGVLLIDFPSTPNAEPSVSNGPKEGEEEGATSSENADQTEETPKAPPVPEITVEQAEAFLSQKQSLPSDYHAVVDDPRYIRMKHKYAPAIMTGKGLKQFAKNKVDPALIPYLGILFHANRATHATKAVKQIGRLKKSGEVSTELSTSLVAMKGAQRSKALQETATAGISAVFSAMPIFEFLGVPGLSAQLAVLGPIGAQLAGKALQVGVKVVVSQGTRIAADQISETTEAFGGFDTCKAFLVYLGYPESKDPIYKPWEEARIRLKTIYGSQPEDNLFKMKKSMKLARYLRKRQKIYGVTNYKLEVPLLLHLWSAFGCWDEMYWDKFVRYKDSTSNLARSAVGAKKLDDIEERRRKRDIRRLEKSAKLLESKTPPVDPHLRLVDGTLESEREKVLTLMVDTFLHSNRVFYLINNKKLRLDQASKVRSYFKVQLDYFFEHHAFVWGYFDQGTDELIGCSVWEHPDTLTKIDVSSLLVNTASFSIGASRLKRTLEVFKCIEGTRKEDVLGLKCWVLHWLAVRPGRQKSGIGHLLMENCILRHQEPIYLQVLDVERDVVDFFKKHCFVLFKTVPTSVQYFGQNVSILCMWHGMESAEEMRAKLPPKQESALALTLRKTGSQIDNFITLAAQNTIRRFDTSALLKGSSSSDISRGLPSTAKKALPAPESSSSFSSSPPNSSTPPNLPPKTAVPAAEVKKPVVIAPPAGSLMRPPVKKFSSSPMISTGATNSVSSSPFRAMPAAPKTSSPPSKTISPSGPPS